MRRTLKSTVSHFLREEAGSATIDFVLSLSVLGVVLAAAYEIGILNLRHAFLERGLDMAAREVRLSTGSNPDYAQLKDMICENAYLLPDCANNLKLEMQVVDPRAFVPIPSDADCQNAAQDPEPVRQFQNGLDNQLMLMRACYGFEPFFPTTGVGEALIKDGQGYSYVVSTSAFVQEPR